MTVFFSKGEDRTACRTGAALPNQQLSDSCFEQVASVVNTEKIAGLQDPSTQDRFSITLET